MSWEGPVALLGACTGSLSFVWLLVSGWWDSRTHFKLHLLERYYNSRGDLVEGFALEVRNHGRNVEPVKTAFITACGLVMTLRGSEIDVEMVTCESVAGRIDVGEGLSCDIPRHDCHRIEYDTAIVAKDLEAKRFIGDVVFTGYAIDKRAKEYKSKTLKVDLDKWLVH